MSETQQSETQQQRMARLMLFAAGVKNGTVQVQDNRVARAGTSRVVDMEQIQLLTGGRRSSSGFTGGTRSRRAPEGPAARDGSAASKGIEVQAKARATRALPAVASVVTASEQLDDDLAETKRARASIASTRKKLAKERERLAAEVEQLEAEHAAYLELQNTATGIVAATAEVVSSEDEASSEADGETE